MHFPHIKVITILTGVLIIGLFVGCAANNPIRSPDYHLPKDASFGIVVGSITISSGDSCFKTHWGGFTSQGHVYGIEVINTETKNNFVISSGPFYRDFDDEIGHGWPFAKELPAGNYLVSRWGVKSGAAFLISSQPISIPLTLKIEPGSATYLGNFHFLEVEHSLACAPKAASVSIGDLSERDIPILKKRYPVINDIHLILTDIASNKIDSIGGDGNYDSPPLIFDFKYN